MSILGRSPLPLLGLLLLAAAPAAGEEPAAPAAAESEEAYVAATTGDDVRVRAGANQDYRVLERLPRGSWVVVVGSEGEFKRVRVPGGVPVFVHRDLVEAREDGTAEVTREDVLMRPTPGQEYFPLDGQKLRKGDRVRVLAKEQGDDGAWLKVLPPGEVAYFIHDSLLERVGTPEEKRDDLARVDRERRDGYTGGSEAAEAAEAIRAMEAAFAAMVDGAAEALRAAPEGAMPPGAAKRREELRQVMTESGAPDTRVRASQVARDYVDRERTLEIARVRAEKVAVKEDLERRLAEVEEAHRRALAEVLRAAPAPRRKAFLAIGTLRRTQDGFQLVKGGVVLHHVDSLRYDLEEMVGMRVGVDGRRIEVDPARRLTLLRVDALEILD